MAFALSTPLDTLCRLILRGREREAQLPGLFPEDEDDGDEEEDEFAMLDDEADAVVEEEMRALLEDLAEDQIAEVLALALIGRGTYDASEWEDALEAASDPDAENPITRLMEMPMLAAYLDSGLAAFDLSCDGVGQLD